MKFRTLCAGFLAGCTTTILAAGTLGLAQDPQDMEAAWAAAMEKYAVPGPEHERLARMVGEWEADIKMWQMPNSAPSTMTGACENELIMDGRYLAQHFTGEFEGMPFEGGGLVAYDRLGEEWIGIWIDNFSTGIMVSRGELDGATLVMEGDIPDYMSGQYVPSRSTERIVNDDTIVSEMFMPGPDGEMFKHMEITYRRQ